MPKHVGVENLERINKKIHYFFEHLLVFLQTVLQDGRLIHQDVPQLRLCLFTKLSEIVSNKTFILILCKFVYIIGYIGLQWRLLEFTELHLKVFFMGLVSIKDFDIKNGTLNHQNY
jgi:hypothetical protein